METRPFSPSLLGPGNEASTIPVRNQVNSITPSMVKSKKGFHKICSRLTGISVSTIGSSCTSNPLYCNLSIHTHQGYILACSQRGIQPFLEGSKCSTPKLCNCTMPAFFIINEGSSSNFMCSTALALLSASVHHTNRPFFHDSQLCAMPMQ